MKSTLRILLGAMFLVLSLLGSSAFGKSPNNPLRVALLHWYNGNTTGINFPLVFIPQNALPVPVFGKSPKGIAFDGTYLWVANNGSDSVMKIRPSDGTVQGVITGIAKPYGLAFDGANIWVTSRNPRGSTQEIKKIRASSNQVVGTYTVSSNPEGIAFDGSYIWVTASYSGKLIQVNVESGNRMEINVCNTPRGVASDGTNIWVVCEGDGVVKKYSQQGKFINSYKVGDRPSGITFDGTSIWVTNFGSHTKPGNTVTRITEETPTDFVVDNNPDGIAFDGTNIWVACDKSVVNLNLDGAILGKYTGGYNQTSGVAFDGVNVWVTDSVNNRILKF